MSFQNLKKQSSTETLSKELEKLNKGGQSFDDPRMWNIERDKTGNGFATIRFLPAAEGEDVPFVQIFSHGFKSPSGQWFIENCPTTKGRKCPVCEANTALWNSGIPSDKEIARARKRKLRYVSNILVLTDPAHKENEGKNFLFSYGKKIFDKINESWNPEMPGDPKINPFDFWAGRDFKLLVKTVETYANYDSSKFADPKPLFNGDDAQLEQLWKKEYPLAEFVADEKFKSYNDLAERYAEVMGGAVSNRTASTASAPATRSSQSPAPSAAATTAAPFDTADDSSNMDYFRKLANE